MKRLRGKIDRVLVDAPCTGLGTLRRNPDLKARQTVEGLAELNAKQRAILAAAAGLVKPGGRLVYGTCSLLTEENEAVVERLPRRPSRFPARVRRCRVLERQGVKIPGAGEYLHLYPHVHDTDGFFAAVMERRGASHESTRRRLELDPGLPRRRDERRHAAAMALAGARGRAVPGTRRTSSRASSAGACRTAYIRAGGSASARSSRVVFPLIALVLLGVAEFALNRFQSATLGEHREGTGARDARDAHRRVHAGPDHSRGRVPAQRRAHHRGHRMDRRRAARDGTAAGCDRRAGRHRLHASARTSST